MNDYGLVEVVEPTWIKLRASQRAKPLLLSFGGEVPLSIDIPGELMRSRVYEYKQRLLMCRNAKSMDTVRKTAAALFDVGSAVKQVTSRLTVEVKRISAITVLVLMSRVVRNVLSIDIKKKY